GSRGGCRAYSNPTGAKVSVPVTPSSIALRIGAARQHLAFAARELHLDAMRGAIALRRLDVEHVISGDGACQTLHRKAGEEMRSANEGIDTGCDAGGLASSRSWPNTASRRSRSFVKSVQILRFESNDRTATRSFGASVPRKSRLFKSIRIDPTMRDGSRSF